MSDLADRADRIIHAEIAAARLRVQLLPNLQADGYCRFCEEEVADPLVFCDVDCRDDFEKERAALRRCGQSIKNIV